MQIFLVRHAIAAEREGFKLPDGMRPITDRGRRRFRRVVKALVRTGERARVILSSPLVRAVQTAEILAAARGWEAEVEILRSLEPEGRALAVLEAARARDVESVALVGHEPQLSAVASLALGGPLAAPFKKGMVIAIELPRGGGAGTLRFAIAPGRAEPLRSLAELRAVDGEA
jgi:phosphohistidine phosphatase